MEVADARSGTSGSGRVGHSSGNRARYHCERKVFARVRIEPQRTRGLLRMLCQASTVDWIGIGLLLIVLATLGADAARLWIIAVAVVVYGYAAIGNAVATRGRHIGWLLMSGVVALALMGL